jgi:hypothetical protein
MPADLFPQEAEASPAGGTAGGDDRLREALTRLIAMGAHPNYTPENLWAAQGQAQLPSPVQRFDLPGGSPGDYAAMPQVRQDPQLAFPQAMPSTQAPNPEPPPSMPPVPDQPQSAKAPAPFGGKGQVVGPYELPKREQKKVKR